MFPVLYIIFIIIAILYETRVESNIKKRGEGILSAKWSYYAMAISYIILLISTVIEYFVVKREINFILSSLGFLMYTGGHLLRNWSIRTLGDYWSLHIELKEDHVLIKDGPYLYLRHPGYLAVILKGVGFTLIPNAYYTLIYSLSVYILLILIRAYLEEKVLLRRFGDEYLEYQKEVFGFLPIKKCHFKRVKN